MIVDHRHPDGRPDQGAVERLHGAEDVVVEMNRHVVEADINLVIGPVFPHEVVGISGGNKYFIPGCSTHDAIDLSHWVGALIGVEDMIGSPGVTPVRKIINAGVGPDPRADGTRCAWSSSRARASSSRSPSATPSRRGRTRRTSPRRATSSTSTSRSPRCSR
jgi:hypothetical protein